MPILTSLLEAVLPVIISLIELIAPILKPILELFVYAPRAFARLA